MNLFDNTISFCRQISSDYDGYNFLTQIYHKAKDLESSDITFDFSKTQWFEANLSAVLGAILELLESENKKIALRNFQYKVEVILKRNKFFATYRHEYEKDIYGTTVPYRSFSPENDSQFIKYIESEVLTKRDFPKLTKRVGKKITESIFELFENARTHGRCKQIHTCGQYYPNKQPPRLDITIVDMGKTIKSNVNEYLKREMDSAECIDWAVQYGNTTKTGNISGGLGLGVIMEFLKLNNGKMQIISADGYWEYRHGAVSKRLLPKPFPGTIVNIEFNLNDDKIYYLKNETPLEGIF
jgi:hypothetical protein